MALCNAPGSEKNTQPHLAFPTQVSLRQGVLLPAPVLGRIGALFSPPPPPPPLFATNMPSPEFCLKLDLLKGLLELHGNLLWFKGTSRHFPSLIIRSRMWVVGPALDCDFKVVVVSPPALALGFQSAEGFTSSVFIGGLLCGRPFAGPPGATDRSTGPPLESCLPCGPLAANVQYSMAAIQGECGVQPGAGRQSVPAGRPLTPDRKCP